MRAVVFELTCLLTLATTIVPAQAQQPGEKIYRQRCRWCHGDEGRGDGPSSAGMLPRPRDFVGADYKIRSTPHGQLPTDEDLSRVISRGLPGTPMEGWENVLSEEEIRQLVVYIKSLSPRFENESRDPIGPPPSAPGSAPRGEEVYRQARCFMCHGDAGRGDGGITKTLNFEWGLPFVARDFTRGWGFKGGHEPRDIYMRITTGLNGTPMGPYQDLLSEQQRWDLATYVASLDKEPSASSEDFVVAAARVEGDLPDSVDAPSWQLARAVVVPLAGQVVQAPPLRWWTPTAASVTARALWNGTQICFLLEWDDPTGPTDSHSYPDSALLQFAAAEGSKPYFVFGDMNNSVRVWHWQAANSTEEWSAQGSGALEAHTASFRAVASWERGRWHIIFRRALVGEPEFKPGTFVPLLVSVRDGANAERGNVRAISTWLYATLEPPRSIRSWLFALAFLLGAVIAERALLSRIEQ
ncbi:MAG: c-type cytochrome [Acidobacteriota bacterium]